MSLKTRAKTWWEPGPAVGRRRALVKAPDRRALPVFQRAVEDIALAPALEHPLLELGEGLARVDRVESWHRAILGTGRGGLPTARSCARLDRRKRRSQEELNVLRSRVSSLLHGNVPALVLVALISAAGTAVAAATIDGGDVRNSSLTGRDIRNKSLTKADIRGRLRGPAGPRGATGPSGVGERDRSRGPIHEHRGRILRRCKSRVRSRRASDRRRLSCRERHLNRSGRRLSLAHRAGRRRTAGYDAQCLDV